LFILSRYPCGHVVSATDRGRSALEADSMSDAVLIALITTAGGVAVALIGVWLKWWLTRQRTPQPSKEIPMDSCYGRWTWVGDEETFQLELLPPCSFRATNANQAQWKGTWYVRNGSLVLAQTH
jgi:hypothetical protein